MGNCYYCKYILLLFEYVFSGCIDLVKIFIQVKLIGDVIEVFEVFDCCEIGWIKVELVLQKCQVEGGEECFDECVVDELVCWLMLESGVWG